MPFFSYKNELRNNMSTPVYHFAIRLDAASVAATRFQTVCKAMFDHWIFQHERGEGTGRDHYQCYAHTKSKVRASQLGQEIRALLEYEGSLYCQPASNSGKAKLKYYCMKEETRVAGPWSDALWKVPKEYQGNDVKCIEESPRPWQKFIMDKLEEEPHHRRINCVVDEQGNMGKTTLQKYLTWKGKSIQVPIGTASQLKTYICNIGPGPNCYMINFNRCMGKENTYRDVLTVCEDLKAGWVQPVMYGGGKAMMIERPHVWIFCNEAPPTKLLSPDMWKFWQYSPGTQSIVPFVPKVPERVCRVRHYQHTSSVAPDNAPTPWDQGRSVRQRRAASRAEEPIPWRDGTDGNGDWERRSGASAHVDEYISIPIIYSSDSEQEE